MSQHLLKIVTTSQAIGSILELTTYSINSLIMAKSRLILGILCLITVAFVAHGHDTDRLSESDDANTLENIQDNRIAPIQEKDIHGREEREEEKDDEDDPFTSIVLRQINRKTGRCPTRPAQRRCNANSQRCQNHRSCPGKQLCCGAPRGRRCCKRPRRPPITTTTRTTTATSTTIKPTNSPTATSTTTTTNP